MAGNLNRTDGKRQSLKVMPMSNDILFTPFSYKSLNLPNRIAMSPMTRNFSPDGVPDEAVARYYRRRAEAGAGLIISEGTVVERRSAKNAPNIPHFYGDAALEGWRSVLHEVRKAGGRMAPQLWHIGSLPDIMSDWRPDAPLESPSGLRAPGEPEGVALSDEDIADIIATFARSAAAARELGFDAVELHGAHGYLIDQFFWRATNLRDDTFGGATLKERARFGAEILKAVRDAVGPDFVVMLRISQFKIQDFSVKLAETPRELEAWLAPLAEAGADIFHCSQRRFWEPEFSGSELNLAGWAKKVTGQPTITVGSVGLSGDFLSGSAEPASLDELRRRLEAEEFDLVAVGRAMLGDAEWVRKVREERFAELHPFNPESIATLV